MLKKLVNTFNNSVALRSGLWYTIGNVFLKGIVFLTIPIFTRMLSTTDYGIVNTYTAWSAVLSTLIGVSLNGTIANAKYEFKEDLDRYSSSILCFTTILFIFIIIVSNIYIINIGPIIFQSKLLFNCLIVQSYSEFIISLSLARLSNEYRYKEYLIISILSTLLNICLSIALIILYFKSQAYTGRILGGAIITISFALYLYIRIMIKGKVNFDLNYLKFGLILSLPLIPHTLSSTVLSQFDRVMINYYIGPSTAGIYSFTYNIGMVLNVVWSSLNSAWVPWFYEKMNQSDYYKITEKAKSYLIFFSIITIGLVLISPELIKILAPSQYWDGIRLVAPIVLSGYFVFLYSFASNTEFYYKKTKYIAIGSIASAIINIVLNMILIPICGYTVAAYTTLISYILLFIFHWTILKYMLHVSLFRIKDFSYSIISVSILSFVLIMLKNYALARYSLLVFIILISIINRKKILGGFK